MPTRPLRFSRISGMPVDVAPSSLDKVTESPTDAVRRLFSCPNSVVARVRRNSVSRRGWARNRVSRTGVPKQEFGHQSETALLVAFWPATSKGCLALRGGQDPACHLAETDAIARALAPTCQRQAVAVVQKTAGRAAGEPERLRPLPRQFQQTSPRFRRWTADRPGGQQIARPQITAVDRVVRELLAHVPVEILEVGNGDGLWRLQGRRLQVDLQTD